MRRLIFLHELGEDLPNFSDDYATSADAHAIRVLLDNGLREFEEIAPGREQIFDGVLMREGHFPLHIGTVIRPGLLIHIERDRSSVAESYRNNPLRHRVLGFYRQRR